MYIVEEIRTQQTDSAQISVFLKLSESQLMERLHFGRGLVAILLSRRFGTVVELSLDGVAMVTNHLGPRFLGRCMWDTTNEHERGSFAVTRIS